MTAIKLSTAAFIATVALAIGATSANAADNDNPLDLGNLVVAACGSGGDQTKAIDELADLCKLKQEGDIDKQVCSRVGSKDPRTCADLSAEDADDKTIECRDSNHELKIDINIDLPTGYSLKGNIELDLEVHADVSDVEECNQTDKNAKGTGGQFVSMTGNAKFRFTFTGTGTGKATLSGPGTSVELSATATCDVAQTIPVYRVGEVASCKKRSTCYVADEYGEYGENGEDCCDSNDETCSDPVQADPTEPHGMH